MTDSQRAAQEIWAWMGSEECEDLVESDLAECEHDAPKHTSEEIDLIARERIRQIIDEHLC